jgi:hypothetical protein
MFSPWLHQSLPHSESALQLVVLAPGTKNGDGDSPGSPKFQKTGTGILQGLRNFKKRGREFSRVPEISKNGDGDSPGSPKFQKTGTRIPRGPRNFKKRGQGFPGVPEISKNGDGDSPGSPKFQKTGTGIPRSPEFGIPRGIENH